MAADATKLRTGLLALLLVLLGVGCPWWLSLAADTSKTSLPLQLYIDTTPPGGVLQLAPGIYHGPAIVGKPLTIDGLGQVTVDGGGRGTVITVRADGVVVRGLRIVNSGDLHDQLDAGLAIEGNSNLIENNVFDDVLFGISLKQARHNRIIHNTIRSKNTDSADRGDGLRLWYSMDNRIENNTLTHMRDITVTNSPYNRFIGNRINDSRRAMNFLFSHRSLIEGNTLSDNSTGIVVLNSEGMIIRGNRILHAMDASAAGIALKESSAALVEGNEILHCAVGLLADSPLHPINRISLVNNRFAYNITAINFYGEKGGHLILDNRFINNLWQATVGNNGIVDINYWYGNYWDDYQGFDRDRDGTGDTPYQVFDYADRIWIENPNAKFFRNAPVLELLDFLERLAPFSSPNLILEDTAPRAHARPD